MSKHLLRLLYSKFNPKPAFEMASADAVQKLESRALQAEKIIEFLKAEVAELQSVADHVKKNAPSADEKQYSNLKMENEKLKEEIKMWKNRLIEVEKKLGITQVDVSKIFKDDNPVTCASVPEDKPVEQSNEKLMKKKKEKEQPANDTKGGSKGTTASDDLPVDVGRLDLRIGKIVSVKKHPDADSLYVEEVDVGEGKTRTVVSGLVKFVPIEEMENRMVVLLCNLKPAKMRGVSSEAMVLCASTPDKVEVLIPPKDAVPGERVFIEGYSTQPDPVLNPKKKIFETVAVDLKTDNNKQATYKGIPFNVPGKGIVTTASLMNVNIK